MTTHTQSVLLRLAFLLPLLALAGCAGPLKFPSPNSKWRNSVGQLQYSNPKRSIIGDVLVVWQDSRDFQFEFTHGPVTLMKLQVNNDIARVESALVRMPWQGHASHPPKPLRSWIALRDVFTQLAAKPESSGHVTIESKDLPAWKAEADLDPAGPAHLRVVFPATRERFVFHFTR
jgi:predicted small lipoprotein YifL